jgi:hypothetical protein
VVIFSYLTQKNFTFKNHKRADPVPTAERR